MFIGGICSHSRAPPSCDAVLLMKLFEESKKSEHFKLGQLYKIAPPDPFYDEFALLFVKLFLRRLMLVGLSK
jgi:hypothetical protein